MTETITSVLEFTLCSAILPTEIITIISEYMVSEYNKIKYEIDNNRYKYLWEPDTVIYLSSRPEYAHLITDRLDTIHHTILQRIPMHICDITEEEYIYKLVFAKIDMNLLCDILRAICITISCGIDSYTTTYIQEYTLSKSNRYKLLSEKGFPTRQTLRSEPMLLNAGISRMLLYLYNWLCIEPNVYMSTLYIKLSNKSVHHLYGRFLDDDCKKGLEFMSIHCRN